MGWFGSGRKPKHVLAEHKFAYVNLADFTSRSCLNYTAYFWIYMATLFSIACYAADIYTAVILLAYNRWTNDTLQEASLVSFEVAKIVFSVCISLSFVLLAIDWWVAVQVLRSDGVAEAYMNVIAVRINCIRGGPARGDSGWKRFLVFSRLTKSRGIVDYLALLTYFAFKGWVRIIFAEGPRVVINALTLISVTRADVIVNRHNSNALDVFAKFGENIGTLYSHNKFQVIILGTMAFTSFMWILAIFRLLAASLIYICYLWHVMSGKESLRKYCKDRIDGRMSEIVQKKHDKAIRKEKQQNGAFLARQPTLPVIADGRNPPPTAAPRYSADSVSSTANLVNHSSARSAPPSSHSTPPPLYGPRREPTLLDVPGLPPRAGLLAGFGPLPSRSGTQRTNVSSSTASTQHYRGPRQQPYSELFDAPAPGDYHHHNYQQQQAAERDGESGYPMQPLAPANTVRAPPFGARDNGWHGGQQPVRQGGQAQQLPGGFPIRPPREPPMAAGQRPGWGGGGGGGGPWSQTANPLSQGIYGPPPRSRTAGPTDAYGPPPRSRTAGPTMHANNASSSTTLPPRSQTAGPMGGGYGAPGGLPQSQAAAGPGYGGYNAPRGRVDDGPGPLAIDWAGEYSGIGNPYQDEPLRSQTAGPGYGGYSAPRGRIDDGPPRSQTVGPAPHQRFPRTADPAGGRGLLGGQYNSGQQEPKAYAGKAKYQPAQRTQDREWDSAATARQLSPPTHQLGPSPPHRTPTAPPIRAELEGFGLPRRADSASPPLKTGGGDVQHPPRGASTDGGMI